jgi:hypothetical protein
MVDLIESGAWSVEPLYQDVFGRTGNGSDRRYCLTRPGMSINRLY